MQRNNTHKKNRRNLFNICTLILHEYAPMSRWISKQKDARQAYGGMPGMNDLYGSELN